MNARRVVVTGAFDQLGSRQVRFLEGAARLGTVTLLLWDDALVRDVTGQPPAFPQAEREYLLRALRHVERVQVIMNPLEQCSGPEAAALVAGAWVVHEEQDTPEKRKFCQARGLTYHVLRNDALQGFPDASGGELIIREGHRRVVVTGCYDWLHSGHVRFFEEVSAYGDLYVLVGHDANIRLLKGEGHPLLPQAERRYLAGAVRHVFQALVTSGEGWLDADPEIQRLKPHLYVVNEDGDRGGKREYCQQRGIEYLVLRRTPAPGLPARTSTALRGF